MTVRQRQPRKEDPAYLAYVSTLPCTICRRPGRSDPAHIRSMSREHGKDITGWRKPDDRWVLPLCRQHHDEQHSTNELEWWASYGIDPFALARDLYARRPSKPKVERPRKARKPRPRRPKSQRAKIVGRTQIPSRKLRSRNELRKTGQ